MSGNDVIRAAYQLWYEFLRRSDKEKWTDDTKLYFDDIWDMPFNRWWQEHRLLIEPLDHSGIWEITNANEFKDYNDRNGVIVWLDLFQPKVKLMKALSHLIDDVIACKSQSLPRKGPGRPKFEFRPTSLDLGFSSTVTEVNIRALKKMLDVFDACTKADRAKARGKSCETRYEIGARLGVSLHHIVKDDDLPADAQYKKQKMNVSVSRYYKRAREVIKNAELGHFPKHS